MVVIIFIIIVILIKMVGLREKIEQHKPNLWVVVAMVSCMQKSVGVMLFDLLVNTEIPVHNFKLYFQVVFTIDYDSF